MQVAGHVQHVDPVDRPGQRVRERHGVDDRAVDQDAAVVADRREDPREGGAGQQRGLERARRRTRPRRRCRGRRPPPAAGSRSSSKVSGVSPRRKTSRRPWLEKRWSSRVRRFQARDRRPPGNTSSPRSDSQVASSRSTPRRLGVGRDRRPVERARRAPDDDVGDDVALEQGAQHPDLATAWLPPPESTNAVRERADRDAAGAG